jgi:hypothetical protein
MDERVVKLPRWAREIIYTQDDRINNLLKAKAYVCNPEASPIVTDVYHDGYSMGFDRHGVTRFKLGMAHVDIHHNGSFLKIYGSRSLNIKPQASNHIHMEVE